MLLGSYITRGERPTYTSLEEETTEPIPTDDEDSLFGELETTQDVLLDVVANHLHTHETSFFVHHSPHFLHAEKITDSDGDEVVNLVFGLKNSFENPGTVEKEFVRSILENLTRRLSMLLGKPIAVSVVLC